MPLKKILVTLIGALALSAACAQAPDLGTKTLYPSVQAPAHKPPAGYRPVFINHVGRHGARHLTKPVTGYSTYLLLQEADSLQALTAEGQRLLRMLRDMDRVEKDHIRSISEEGISEQQAIAKRMYRQNKEVFSMGDNAWKAEITKELRTKETAHAFIGALAEETAGTDSISYAVNDTTLRFYDLSPAYIKFENDPARGQELQTLKNRLRWDRSADHIFNRFFTRAFITGKSPAARQRFVADLYGFLSILPSIEREIKAARLHLSIDSLAQFFTGNELKDAGRIDAAEDYLLKGPGRNGMGIQVKIAAPLLADFIKAVDECKRSGKSGLRLRFSHAETIAPFATLLGLEGATASLQNIARFSDTVWSAARIAPLSANIQWIVYKGRGERMLVKCLLNEREARIAGLATSSFPYYDWQDLRAFYLRKLRLAGLSLTDNYYRYLQALR